MVTKKIPHIGPVISSIYFRKFKLIALNDPTDKVLDISCWSLSAVSTVGIFIITHNNDVMQFDTCWCGPIACMGALNYITGKQVIPSTLDPKEKRIKVIDMSLIMISEGEENNDIRLIVNANKRDITEQPDTIDLASSSDDEDKFIDRGIQVESPLLAGVRRHKTVLVNDKASALLHTQQTVAINRAKLHVTKKHSRKIMISRFNKNLKTKPWA
jgi:hypothetical protein